MEALDQPPSYFEQAAHPRQAITSSDLLAAIKSLAGDEDILLDGIITVRLVARQVCDRQEKRLAVFRWEAFP